MRTALLLLLTLGTSGIEVCGQTSGPAIELLRLTEGDRTHEVALQITVDDQPYDAYWARTLDAVFTFADCNSDGVLSEDEIRLVPSARAVRLSLGSAFTPPVAPIRSLKEIVDSESSKCSKDDLQKYYRRHGVGRPTIGYGKLINTISITNALTRALDADRDGNLSEGEFQKAESALRRLDANDDELIGVGELIPNGTYPGNWAANTLSPTADIDVSTNSRLVLKRSQTTGEENTKDASRAIWQITISDQVCDLPFKLPTTARCESFCVRGPLNGLNDQLREELAKPDAEPSGEAEGTTARGRRPTRAWLTPLVDRDHNGQASQQEIDQWLALQKQLIRGHLLISVYYGGGLFELLDANHDAGLSVRELRMAWQTLKSASCTSGSHLEVRRIPDTVLFVASQGYPNGLARPSGSELEWFRKMDRNSDGDVSRREFTGSLEAFGRLDHDRDGLISPIEANMATEHLQNIKSNATAPAP